jgi:hypothetical protein
MTIQRKEKIQYTTAVGFLLTGIILCFLSFFLNEYDIDRGSLWYLGQSVAFCAAVFSVNLVVKNEMFKVEERLNHKVDRKMRKVDDLIQDEDEQ